MMYQQELGAIRTAGNAVRKIAKQERPISKTERAELCYSLRDLRVFVEDALTELEAKHD